MIQEERPSLIIVDSDLRWAKRLGRLLDREGFEVQYAAEVDEAEAKLKGGDADFNAGIVRAVLGGQAGPHRDFILLTAAAALVIADRAGDLKEGAALAAAAIDDGRANAALDRMIEITNSRNGEDEAAAGAETAAGDDGS